MKRSRLKTYSPLKRTGFTRKKFVSPSRRLRAKPDRRLAVWSKKVRERDDFVCQLTGVRDVSRNIAHHKAPRSRRLDLKYSVENGVTLTPEAHQWVHDHPKEAAAIGLLNTESRELARRLAA